MHNSKVHEKAYKERGRIGWQCYSPRIVLADYSNRVGNGDKEYDREEEKYCKS